MAEPNGEFPLIGTLLIKHSQKEGSTKVVFVTQVTPPKIEVLDRGGATSWLSINILQPGVYERVKGGCSLYDPKILTPDDMRLRLGFGAQPALDVEKLRNDKKDRGTRRLALGDVGR